jgi:hypothetical protein
MLRHSLRLLPRAAPRFASAVRASPAPRALRAPQLPAFAQQQQRRAASSTTPTSSLADPAELESQKALEQGTEALERGDMDEAKVRLLVPAARVAEPPLSASSSVHFCCS